MANFNLSTPKNYGLNNIQQSPLTQGLYQTPLDDKMKQVSTLPTPKTVPSSVFSDPVLRAKNNAQQGTELKTEDFNQDGKISDGFKFGNIPGQEGEGSNRKTELANQAVRVGSAIMKNIPKWVEQTQGKKYTSGQQIGTVARPRGYQEGGGLLKTPALQGVDVGAAKQNPMAAPGNLQAIPMDEKTKQKTERAARMQQAGQSFKNMLKDNLGVIGEKITGTIDDVQQANAAEDQRSADFRQKLADRRQNLQFKPAFSSSYNPNKNTQPTFLERQDQQKPQAAYNQSPQGIQSSAAAYRIGGRLSILQQILK